jgi:hypothetical protein
VKKQLAADAALKQEFDEQQHALRDEAASTRRQMGPRGPLVPRAGLAEFPVRRRGRS